jgi:predicted NBD/HSP70 family sugar kinase
MTALSDGLTVGVDLGGTKIAAGAVDPAGQIVCAGAAAGGPGAG